MKKRQLSYIIAIISIALYTGFFYTTKTYLVPQNYEVHRKIKRSLVDHPEFIPNADTVRISSMGMQTIVADLYWLSAIQYIGSNALGAEYKEYLATMLELVTDLSPHFTYPYQIGLLLLPDFNERYEKIDKTVQQKHIQEALKLGRKGIEKNCDMNKLEKIRNIYDLNKLYADKNLSEGCSDPFIPYYLAYAAYWNNNDPLEASYWYRVAGTHKDAPKGAQLMSAIMQGKTGNREKAIIMFLSLGEAIDPNPNGMCRQLTTELKNVLAPAFAKGAKLTPDFLKEVERLRAEAKKELKENQDEIERTDISAYCSSYLDKSVRELNLQYIQDADARYFEKHGKHAPDAKELFDEKFITFLPKDYQRPSSDDYEIIYYYNEEIKGWDFKMGKYSLQ